MPPITMAFVVTGLAVFLQAMYFLGVGASASAGKKSPILGVGYVSVIAGVIDLVVGVYITMGRPLDSDTDGTSSLLLAGLLSFYGMFFVALGLTEILDLDLRVIGNMAIPTAILPLAWIHFFSGSTTFILILIWWAITFLAIALTTYGKMQGKVLGIILMITSLLTFFLVPVAWALGITLS
ncbi:unannotated protein [freshwater metagenome]|uniref:Unannotated protein n=1 Tax=freshwater metagenome TaxID=449393 RepID=A0A6J7SIC5_9ZZZZ|nr:hypothetical protein [Actinomycetota bacterium]MSW35942.1 hypothetical protein [Actinomycetota bacterium]